MAVYRGVVRDRRIELEGGAALAEGTPVEVRPIGPDAHPQASEGALIARLRAAGVLVAPPPDAGDAPAALVPLTVQGEALSAQIGRERR